MDMGYNPQLTLENIIGFIWTVSSLKFDKLNIPIYNYYNKYSSLCSMQF